MQHLKLTKLMFQETTTAGGITKSVLKIKKIEAAMEGSYSCKPTYGSLELQGTAASLTVLSAFISEIEEIV